MSAERPPTHRPWRGARDAAQARRLVAVALLAAGIGVIGLITGAWNAVENASVDARFARRATKHPSNVVVVGIDDRTLKELGRWPFPRSVDARAIDMLRADHAKVIVYDVQFTKPTAEAQDLALYQAVSHAHNVVLATGLIGPGGSTDVLGGNENLARAHARVGAVDLFTNSSGVIQQYRYSIGGLRTLPVVAAEVANGKPFPASDFHNGSAWIDYPGPVETVPNVSFADVIHGKAPRSAIEGKVVVVGATSLVLQDLHPTSVTGSTEMSGPEINASAIATALAGNPLRQTPFGLALIVTLLAGLATPLSCLTMRPGRALLMGIGLAAAYVLFSQVTFDAGLIVPLSYPLVALAIGTLGALLVSYLAEIWKRELSDRHGSLLEQTVRERTAELYDTQLEVIHRLAQAAELRDDDTGAHIDRVGRLCERVALKLGMAPAEAERLRIASTLHDVGKIGVPDHVLLKRGELDNAEWEEMKAHTTTGAALLAGSSSPLLQMAEAIARTHHERWDGTGYPDGLKGVEIPLVGRICAICDVYDALSSKRPYKDPWPRERILKEIVRKRGTHFDPRAVDAFLEVVGELEVPSADAEPAVSARAMSATR
jgi:CHASE2 domain-containing sensor protein